VDGAHTPYIDKNIEIDDNSKFLCRRRCSQRITCFPTPYPVTDTGIYPNIYINHYSKIPLKQNVPGEGTCFRYFGDMAAVNADSYQPGFDLISVLQS
jgi:hypothetical protein